MCIPYYIYRGASGAGMHTVSILNAATGIPAANQININIAPNPASDVLNWTISNAQVNSINIYSVNGMLIQHSIPTNTRLDIANLNAGIYMIEFNTNKGVVRSRFVKN
jgi:5-hydroxyisourate hydrolase-like protein (transthyretin family)